MPNCRLCRSVMETRVKDVLISAITPRWFRNLLLSIALVFFTSAFIVQLGNVGFKDHTLNSILFTIPGAVIACLYIGELSKYYRRGFGFHICFDRANNEYHIHPGSEPLFHHSGSEWDQLDPTLDDEGGVAIYLDPKHKKITSDLSRDKSRTYGQLQRRNWCLTELRVPFKNVRKYGKIGVLLGYCSAHFVHTTRTGSRQLIARSISAEGDNWPRLIATIFCADLKLLEAADFPTKEELPRFAGDPPKESSVETSVVVGESEDPAS